MLFYDCIYQAAVALVYDTTEAFPRDNDKLGLSEGFLIVTRMIFNSSVGMVLEMFIMKS